MSSKKKSKKSYETILTMTNGDTYRVVSSEGRYYICETTKFRKTNPDIASIDDVEIIGSSVENERDKEDG